MEQSNSLLLNEEALKQCSDQTKPIFIYEWLRYLDRILPVTQKVSLAKVSYMEFVCFRQISRTVNRN